MVWCKDIVLFPVLNHIYHLPWRRAASESWLCFYKKLYNAKAQYFVKSRIIGDVLVKSVDLGDFISTLWTAALEIWHRLGAFVSWKRVLSRTMPSCLFILARVFAKLLLFWFSFTPQLFHPLPTTPPPLSFAKTTLLNSVYIRTFYISYFIKCDVISESQKRVHVMWRNILIRATYAHI